jgi:hypothetical protein
MVDDFHPPNIFPNNFQASSPTAPSLVPGEDELDLVECMFLIDCHLGNKGKEKMQNADMNIDVINVPSLFYLYLTAVIV